MAGLKIELLLFHMETNRLRIGNPRARMSPGGLSAMSIREETLRYIWDTMAELHILA